MLLIVLLIGVIVHRPLGHLHQATRNTAALTELTQVSPVAWQDINLYGRYEFTRVPAPIDVDTMAAALAQHAG